MHSRAYVLFVRPACGSLRLSDQEELQVDTRVEGLLSLPRHLPNTLRSGPDNS